VRYFRFQVKNYIRVLRSNLEAQILIMFPWRSVRCHERFIVSEKEKLDKRNSSNDLTKVILFYKQFSQ